MTTSNSTTAPSHRTQDSPVSSSHESQDLQLQNRIPVSKLPLSLVIVTYNEERNLVRCIESVPMASEIIVVDSLSTDATVKIAEKYQAKVYAQAFLGFGKQKKLATDYASHDWVLSLDADEALSTELQQELMQRFTRLDPQCGYRLPRRSFHLGRWIRHGGWYPDYQLRLFNKKHSQWKEVEIHESVVSLKVDRFQTPILHWVFRDISHQVITNDKYSSLQAKELFLKNKKFSWAKLWTKPPTKFIECYFWKLGFLDGVAGLFIAISASYSVFLKWAKLWELERNVNKSV